MGLLTMSLDLDSYQAYRRLMHPMVKKGQWHDYEDGKKKEYGEFVRKAREFAYARPAPPSHLAYLQIEKSVLSMAQILRVPHGSPARR